MTAPDHMALLPCPFCGDPMHDRGYGAIHVEPGKCPIGTIGVEITAWNTRAQSGVIGEMREALERARDEIRCLEGDSGLLCRLDNMLLTIGRPS